MIFNEASEIIDISQPINENSAVFPGDTPFQREITVDYTESAVINLSSFTMSPHVGTHADAPLHLKGSLKQENSDKSQGASKLPLYPYIGPVSVIELSPCSEPINVAQFTQAFSKCPDSPKFPKRLLFKTRNNLRYDVFESDYASFSPELIDYLAKKGVILIGIDTPSVDPIDSKTLDAHHSLIKNKMYWLENLNLENAPTGHYLLSALPLKFKTLEASPLRAVLLK